MRSLRSKMPTCAGATTLFWPISLVGFQWTRGVEGGFLAPWDIFHVTRISRERKRQPVGSVAFLEDTAHGRPPVRQAGIQVEHEHHIVQVWRLLRRLLISCI